MKNSPNSPSESGDQVTFRSARARRGYTAFPNAVLFSGAITPTARVLYGLLCEYARQSGHAYPGQVRLGRELGSRKHGPLSDRQVRTYLVELVGLGLITIERQGDKRTNWYYIEDLPDWLFEEPPSQSDRKYTSGPDRQDSSVPDRKPTAAKEVRKDLRTLSKKNDSNALPQEGERSTIPQSTPAPPAPVELYNPWIGLTINDYSREFNDADHWRSNLTQALRLWQASGLTDEVFVRLLQQAKMAVRHAQAHQVTNKMAYFFAVLRDYLERELHPNADSDTETGPGPAAQVPPPNHPAA